MVITGTNLTGATSVNFGGFPAGSYTVDSATQITAVTQGYPSATVDVQVVTPNGTATALSAFTFVYPPSISGLTPNSGPATGGTSVTISGNSFTGATAVTFGGVAATSFTVNSSNLITAVTPAGTVGLADVVVTAPLGTATRAGGFTYISTTPTITNVFPASGSTAGGARININGTNLTGATAVTFGGTPALAYVVSSPYNITAWAPPGTAGSATIVVTTPNGTASSSAFSYVLPTAPLINGFNPNAGSTAGGTSVKIYGSGFTGASAVSFGSVAATSFTVDSPTVITAVTPAASAGPVTVTVTTPNGTVTTSAVFTYFAPPTAAPTISGVNPTTLSVDGGANVTIQGTGFIGATAVTFGTTPATSFIVQVDGFMTAVAPPGLAGASDVSVTTPQGTATRSSAVTYIAAPLPVVTAISPSAGPIAGGTTVVITGSGFTGATSVYIGGPATSFTVDSDTQITAVTGAATTPGAVPVRVTGPGGSNVFMPPFTYTSSSFAAPTISGVSPASGPVAGGNSVVITGTNLNTVSTVYFGNTRATWTIVDSATQLTVGAPAGSAGAVNLTVNNLGGSATASSAYTYGASTPAPTISGVAPTSGPLAGGTSVVITGTNLTGASAVSFGGTAATSYTVDSATQITAVAPAGSAGAVAVAVTTTGGTASASGAFTYIAAPTITTVAPSSGPLAGGTSVVITGTGFTGTSAVSFGGTAATSYRVDSATQITAVAPAGSAGTVAVAVTTTGGTASASGTFTYTAAPTITTVAPSSGPLAGGTSVVITGTGFTGASTVSFGGTAATGYTVDSATQITAVAPAGSAGTVAVAVTTTGGTASASGTFTYVAAPTVAPRAGVSVVFNSTGTAIDLTSSISGSATTVAIVTPPAHGTATASGKVITYVPTAGYSGDDSFTYTATGPGGTSASALVSLTVAVPVPTAASQSAATGDNQMVSIELTRGATGGPFTAAQVVSVSPANAATTRIVSTGSGASQRFFLEATPAARFGGTINIGYTLSNASGTSSAANVTITVTARPDPANDPMVRAISEGQVQATRRFGRSQIANFMRRNEQLHNAHAGSAQNVSINVIDPMRASHPEAMSAAAGKTAGVRDGHRYGGDRDQGVSAGEAAAKNKQSDPSSRVSVWMGGAIDIATRDASGVSPKLSATTSGLSGGVDFRIDARSAIGIGGGYGHSAFNFNGQAARMQASTSLVAIYGTTQIVKDAFLDAMAGHGALDYKTSRRIVGTELTARGNRTGTMDLAALSFGVAKQLGKLDWSLYGKVEYIHTKLNGYVESGADRYNLQFAAMNDSLFTAAGGLKVERQMETGIGFVTPRLRAEWGREAGRANLQYVDYADIFDAQARSISTPSSGRLYYQISPGTRFDLKNEWSLDFEYELMRSNAMLSSGVKIQITRPF